METKRRRAVTAGGHRGELRVAAVQMRFAATIAGNLATIDRLVEAAVAGGADAVLLPECATTGYSYDFPSLTPTAARAARTAVGVRLGKS